MTDQTYLLDALPSSLKHFFIALLPQLAKAFVILLWVIGLSEKYLGEDLPTAGVQAVAQVDLELVTQSVGHITYPVSQLGSVQPGL